MRMLVTSCVCAVAALGAALVFPPMRSEAKDYGQAAQAFPVIEPDLLSTIEARLRRAEASGELARTNEMFAKRVEAKVRRPDPGIILQQADVVVQVIDHDEKHVRSLGESRRTCHHGK